MLELDCHLTKDEKVVVSHDGNLKRSTGVSVNISELDYCVSIACLLLDFGILKIIIYLPLHEQNHEWLP